MICTLEVIELADYTSRQLNSFYPDNNSVDLKLHQGSIQKALKRLEFCFSKITLKHYFDGEKARFNHLYSDHYVMYLWFLANTLWHDGANAILCSKLYYLNKSLHGFDCMYDTKLPNIFIVLHGVGTMLGKASYSDYFVVFHGCTVGINKGFYPVIGERVTLTAHSSVIGNCDIRNNCTIGTYTGIVDTNVESNMVVFRDREGKITMKRSNNIYAHNYFLSEF